MKIVRAVKEMQKLADNWRANGKKIALVPTMGFLHDGHLSLMKEACRRADVIVTSIFVNPAQFGPNEDLANYPNDFEDDETKCKAMGVGAVYYPSADEMYPDGYKTYVHVEEMSNVLCGEFRPIHFRGVTTVCAKLFNAVKPHIAVFGRKDYQQLVIIKHMVADLDMDLEIIGMPTLREEDGLAMSSRNKYLSEDERARAAALFRALQNAKQAFDDGQGKTEIIAAARETLKDAEPCKVEYVEMRSAETLEEIDETLNQPAVLALAVRIGSARLIDNIVLGN